MADVPPNNPTDAKPGENPPTQNPPAGDSPAASGSQTPSQPANNETQTPSTENKPENTSADAPKTDTSNPETPASDKPADPAAAANTTPPAKPFSKKLLFTIAALFIVGTAALVASFFVSGSNKQNKQAAETTNTTVQNVQPTKAEQSVPNTVPDAPQQLSKLLVYGSWSGQTSLIKAIDIVTQKTVTLASLPSSIKKVNVLSSETVLFIDQTDTRDHGKQIVIYNIKTKAPLGSIVASPGFKIDDYVISPDKKYIAVWEVSFAPNSEVLLGGKSRVFAVDLARPTVKKQLYDEVAEAGKPVHYPSAITNSGRVFADKFLPNDSNGGAGWAYGMSVVDFDGTNRQDLPQMQAGTYGTQPLLSPDGTYLVFAGYDGTQGDGNAVVNGYRRAIVAPNTVELLDTENFTRQKLPDLNNTNAYTAASWDPTSKDIIITIISEQADVNGVYTYNVPSRRLTKIAIPTTSADQYGFLTEITDNTAIIGTQDKNAAALGNLGEHYAYPFTQLALLDYATQKVSYIEVEDTYAQFITLLSGDYFKGVLGIQAQAQELPMPTFVDLFSDKNEAKARQQLYTFLLKSDLSKIRLNQQSTPLIALNGPSDVPDASGLNIPPGFKQNKNSPKCEELAEQQCAAQGTTPDNSSDDDAYKSCVRSNKFDNMTGAKFEGKCHDSPLYLYGTEGQQVQVTIQTPVSNAIPAYNNGYNVTLLDDGKMQINGKTYASIAYDYQSNLRRVTPPNKGTIVKRSALESVLRNYAQKLGLNEKETADLVQAGKSKTYADYVFISFFDHKTSQQILPIVFAPEPDNYLNVVFYFKNLINKPNYTPAPPVFPEPLQRNGFTAVEVSELVE